MALFGKKKNNEDSFQEYTVLYLGGHPGNSKRAYNIDFILKADEFEVKSHFKDKNFSDFTIRYESVISFDIVNRQISTAEGILGGIDSRQLNQPNNIHITYLTDDGKEITVRVEMITGVSVMGQAKKCAELIDFMKTNDIFGRFKVSKPKADASDSSIEKIEKLANLYEKGIISEEEFAQKKAELLEKI